MYGDYARRYPDSIRIVAVVEPDAGRRRRFGEIHNIPPSRQFADHESVGVDAPAWIIASSDRHHVEPALAALSGGAHVLVEKPIAATYADSRRLVDAARLARRQLHVAHVLRYTPFFTTLNEIVRSGRLGEIITVEHRENVVYWHMAHSFVRGNWARGETSTPMVVQKCCHDFDILEWNAAAPVRRLHSFGSLMHFRPEHAPPGAPPRCTDGCPAADSCHYEATRLYTNEAWSGWPVHVVTDDLSPAGRLQALKEGPYGRCVYTAGSDVVDHQVVAMERADGSTGTLIMHGHAAEEARTMRYDGTHATLRGYFGRDQSIEIHQRGSGEVEKVEIRYATGGHGGGDGGLMEYFTRAVTADLPARTSGEEALESHLLAFAAEESRVTGRTIDLDDRRDRPT